MRDEREVILTSPAPDEETPDVEAPPRVDREVEPETLVSTVEAELTSVPLSEGGAELQPDADPGGSATVEPGVEGEPRDLVRLEDVDDVVGPASPAASPASTEARGLPTHGRFKTWVIVAAILAGCGALAFAATLTPLFAADTVRVEGARHLSPGQVRRIAKVQPGVNVFRLDEGRAERRLERNVWVADATVTKHLPSQVTIVIQERVPVALATTTLSGDRSIVAADGTILAPATERATLPLVEAADGAPVPSDEQRSLGATVAASLPPELVRQVASVRAGDDGAVGLILDGGVAVSYGDAHRLAQKGQATLAVLRWAERSGVRLGSVDVGTPGAPTASLPGSDGEETTIRPRA